MNITIPFTIYLVGEWLVRKLKIRVQQKIPTIICLSLLSFIFLLQLLNITIIDLSKTADVIERIVPGNDPISRLINVGSTYGKYYGIIALFVPIGALEYVVKLKKSSMDYLIIVITTISTFFILDVQYFRYFFPPISAILATNGMYRVLKILGNQNFILGVAILMITIFTSSQYLYFYITNGIILPVIITFLGFAIAIFGFLQIHLKSSEKAMMTIFIGFILLPTSWVVATAPCRAIELYDEQNDNYGKIFDQNQGIDNALWTISYIQGNFMSEIGGTDLGITGVNGIASYDSFLNISHDQKLILKLETEFNLSLLFNSEDTFYDIDLEVRYNPQKLQKQVFVHGDTSLIETSELNFIIFFSHTNVKWYGLYQYKIIEILNEKYILYQTSLISIYHYSYYP